MSESHKGSRLAGLGGIAVGVLTVVGLEVGSAPGGNYGEADVATYVGIGHLPTVIVTGYLAMLGVLGLICLLAYLREEIAAQPDRAIAANIFWGAGIASAASFAVGWGLVTGIAVSAGHAVGVHYVLRGEAQTAHAEGEVILAAGAIGSPQLLMLSGIGPADHLLSHGITVEADSPGVGANLSDHPAVTAMWHTPKSRGPWEQAGLTWAVTFFGLQPTEAGVRAVIDAGPD